MSKTIQYILNIVGNALNNVNASKTEKLMDRINNASFKFNNSG